MKGFECKLLAGRALWVDLEEPNCAQIVPVKVKYFQTVPNETKNTEKNWNRIKRLESQYF